jgi:lysophospholipase L1-like esterase
MIVKIICFGDSLTRGVSYINGRLRIIKESYPSLLQQFFSSNPSVTVINKGVFNDNSDLLIQRLIKDVISEIPHYVIISIGGNDCNFRWDQVAQNPEKEHQAIVPIDRYQDNVKKIIRTIQESGITPILLTLPPLDPARYYKHIVNQYDKSISHRICMVGGIEHWHSLYNRRLNHLIELLHVIKIDVRTALKKTGDCSELISDDGIHLTSEGYKQMSIVIFNELKNLLEFHKEQY